MSQHITLIMLHPTSSRGREHTTKEKKILGNLMLIKKKKKG